MRVSVEKKTCTNKSEISVRHNLKCYAFCAAKDPGSSSLAYVAPFWYFPVSQEIPKYQVLLCAPRLYHSLFYPISQVFPM